jgi:hypothetical protein
MALKIRSSGHNDPDSSWSTTPGTHKRVFFIRPSGSRESDAPNGEALLLAIAKARNWIEDLVEARASSFAEIATREGRV